VEAFISGFRPYGVGTLEASFARQVVARSRPVSCGRARSLLWASSRLCAFGLRRGLSPDPEVLLRISVIERFVEQGCSSYTAGAKRTIRSNLLWLNHRLLDTELPLGALSRERSSAPYSPREISAYLALADAQPTEARRMRASGLISLGAGAGMLGTDLRMLKGTDIGMAHGAVVVCVSGSRARQVPVRAEFADHARQKQIHHGVSRNTGTGTSGTSRGVALIVKRRAELAHLDPAEYSGNLLRAG
jgi:hypothetical protein